MAEIAGGAVGGVIGAAAIAACVAVYCLKKKKKQEEVLRKQASAYSSWHDGVDGDEMQRSSVTGESLPYDTIGRKAGLKGNTAAAASAYVAGATRADDEGELHVVEQA
jgi:hypothetical protein